MALPENVFRIVKPNRVYFYHQRFRKKPKGERGPLTRIDHDPHEPEFWLKAAELNGRSPDRAVPADIAGPVRGTFRWLIEAYTTSLHWQGLALGTQNTYTTYLNVIKEAWGDDLVADLDVEGIIALRDTIAKTARSGANMMITVLRALLKWGINNGKCRENPARDIENVDTEVEHAFPWPAAVWKAALTDGPADVARFAFLGRVTGQRISDVVRMRPADLKGDLFHIKVKKLRGKTHLLPVTREDLKVIKSWKVADLTPFCTRPDGSRHTEKSMRNAVIAWIESTDFEQRPGEEIRPHGLRALACCDARLKGLPHEDIAALYRMSVGLVKTYTHHIDKEAEARNALAKRGAVQTIQRIGANRKG